MAPATKPTPRTAEEQEKWDKDILEKMDALPGMISCRERYNTVKFKENTGGHLPSKRESTGRQAAKVADWGGGVFLICLTVLMLATAIVKPTGLPVKWFDQNQPLPEAHQTSSPKVGLLKNLPDLNSGKEPTVEGKKPMGEEEDVFVEVDLNDDEDYEMVEKEEAEIAEWEQV